MNAPLSRRNLLQAGSAALGAAMVPIAATMTLAHEALAAPLVFEPADFIADLSAAGAVVIAYRAVPRGGEPAEPGSYFIRPSKGRGFGDAYTAAMGRWWNAIEACPDHAERVATHVLGPIGRTA